MSQTSKRFSNTKFLKFRVTKYQIKIPPWLEATQPYHILDIITQHQTQTENRELSKSKNVPTINARWQPLKQAIRSIPANRKKKLSVESAFLSFFLIDLKPIYFYMKMYIYLFRENRNGTNTSMPIFRKEGKYTKNFSLVTFHY